MIKSYVVSLIILILFVSTVSCNATYTPSPEDVDSIPDEIFTAAVRTVNARKTAVAGDLPTLPPQALIKTYAASTSTPVPTVTSTLTPSPVQPSVTPTPTIVNTLHPKGDLAVFVSDITIPDGTIMQPFEPFTKTWRLRNRGTTTWTTDYSLVFVSGDLMGGNDTVPLAAEVSPGKYLDISVPFVAPSTAGRYRGYWNLRNADGQMIGMGGDPKRTIWVDIEVSTSHSPEDTSVPTPVYANITNLSLEVGNEQVNTVCPYEFTLTAEFTLKKGETLIYQIEMGLPLNSPTIKLPPPETRTFGVGTYRIVYKLNFSQSLDTWARFFISKPFQLRSNEVHLTLECK